MKNLILAAAMLIGASASANEIMGQMSMYCTAKTQPLFIIAVYRDIKSDSTENVYVTTPLGFVGRGTQKVVNNHMIVDVPVLSEKPGRETLDVDLSTDKCKPSGTLKDVMGNSVDLNCINNDSSC
jgi:hypothetical protein